MNNCGEPVLRQWEGTCLHCLLQGAWSWVLLKPYLPVALPWRALAWAGCSPGRHPLVVGVGIGAEEVSLQDDR